jgi:putative flippase GtrA
MTISPRRETGEITTARRLPRIRGLVRQLRTPGPSIVHQGLRFGLAGGIVALVYLTVTTVLAEAAGLPFEKALAIGFAVALVVHFTLQRLFVWTHHEEFALPLHRQVGRYLTVAGAQYGVTAASTALLPSALGVSAEAVYLVTVALVVCVNFLVFRHGIFHAKPADPEAVIEASPPHSDSERQSNPSRAGG